MGLTGLWYKYREDIHGDGPRLNDSSVSLACFHGNTFDMVMAPTALEEAALTDQLPFE